jgi:serine protease AprX
MVADAREDPEALREARRLVRRLLGEALEGKASDEFCLAAAQEAAPERRVWGFGAETVGAGAPAAPVSSVVEFSTPRTEAADWAPETSPEWLEVRDAIRRLPSPSRARPLRAAALVRQARIATVREQAYRVVGPVYDEIERLSGGLLRRDPSAVGSPQIPTLVNQVCWLNGTVRTWSDPRSLAEVAADDAVAAIDVTRRLMPDASPNQAAVGIPAYRAEHGLDGAGVTVAVIDSEVSLAHPALAGRVVHRRNYTPEPWGSPDVHGTAVAGILAADDPEHAGIAPGAIVYNYKVLATNRVLNGDDFGGALALQQALEDGCQVANCSWGAGPAGDGNSREARAVDAAWALGMVVVKSAGNRGPEPSTLTSPADADGILVVGATDVDGSAIQDYSSRGPAPNDVAPRPHVVAPGGAENAEVVTCLAHGGFGGAGTGTSFAAPHVAGIAALLLQQDPELSPDGVRELLLDRARPLDGEGPDVQGRGFVQL